MNWKEFAEIALPYINKVVVLFGLTGNIAAFVTFSRRRFRYTIFNVYFRALIVSDSLVLLSVTRAFIGMDPPLLMNALPTFTGIRCSLVHVLFITGLISSSTSSHILTLVAADRFVSLAFPFRFVARKRAVFQLSLCSTIFLFNLLTYLIVDSSVSDMSSFGRILNEHDDNILTAEESTLDLNETLAYECAVQKECTVQNMCVFIESDEALSRWDALNSSIVPFVLMFIFTALTIGTIVRARLRKPCASVHLRYDMRLSILTISLSLVFLMLTLPYALRLTVPSFRLNIDQVIEDCLYEIFDSIHMINFGLTFYINLFFNRVFKRLLFDTIFLRLR